MMHYKMLSAEKGTDDQRLVRDPLTSSITYDDESTSEDPYIVEGSFDESFGILQLVRSNGEVVEIYGFPTESDAQPGATGRKGKTGDDGEDGDDGDDGEDGDTGCDGPTGPIGKTGQSGTPGETGVTGPTGIRGGTGPTGNAGVDGEEGRIGNQGEIGNEGMGCFTGPPGPPGPGPYEYVLVQTNEPAKEEVYAWGIPDIEFIDDDELSGDVDFTLTPINFSSNAPTYANSDGSLYEARASMYIIGFMGGVGPFEIQWDGDYVDEGAMVYEVGERGRALQLAVRANVEPGESETFFGTVRCAIKDRGKIGTPVVRMEQDYTFAFTNNAEDMPWLDSGFDPSDEDFTEGETLVQTTGAVLQGTQIALSLSGGDYPAELLTIGQDLASYYIPDLPDNSSLDQFNFINWYKANLDGCTSSNSTISTILLDEATEYVMLNNILRVLPDTYVMVIRSGVYSFEKAYKVTYGDYLVNQSMGGVLVTDVVIKRDPVDIVRINVETDDMYWADGFLIHD